jgi:hypothetical protein
VLTFAQQQVGTASAAQQVTLTNTGDEALTLIAASTLGDFSVVNSCANSLNGHSSCSMNVVFNPRNVGLETGTLTVADEYRSQTVALSGTGVAPAGVSLAPTQGLSFGATGVGVTSAVQTVTLTNNGGLPLSIGSVGVTGDFVVAANGCGASLAQGSACAIQVAFAPTAGGARTGTLTVVSNAANSPQTMALNGAGVNFTLAADGASTVTVSSGQSGVFPLLLGSDAAVSGTATFACSGAPVNSVCTVFPATVSLGSTTVVSVTVQTGVGTSASLFAGRRVWLALAVPVCFAFRRRRWGAVVMVCCLVAVSGCGSGRRIPGDGSPGSSGGGAATPAGSYGIVVSASSAGLSRTVNLSLVVQ